MARRVRFARGMSRARVSIVIALLIMLVPMMALRGPIAQGDQRDSISIGEDNTSSGCSGAGDCFCPCPTTLDDSKNWFPYSSFLVRNHTRDLSNGAAAGYAITGESYDGTGLLGFAHGNDAAVVASNDSGPGDRGEGLHAVSSYGNGVFATTKGIDVSGVYGENLGGQGYGVVGRTTSPQRPAVWGDNTGGGDGVQGFTGGATSSGVFGKNTAGGKGVFGASTTGNGVEGGSNGGNGVQGESAAATASGVYGQNSASGYGVAGRANQGTGVLGDSTNGVGVWANSQNGLALRVSGRASFSRSGSTLISAGLDRIDVPMMNLHPGTLVTATLQGIRIGGVWVASANVQPFANKFTIYLNKAVPTGKTATIGWFVVN
jgi:hypothetical protein